MELARILPDKALPAQRTEVDFMEAVVQAAGQGFSMGPGTCKISRNVHVFACFW